MERPASTDPIARLLEERAIARDLQDPCANLCTFASVDHQGMPDARTLVLRELDGELAVFSNRTSPKWRQVEARGSVAVVVWLPSQNLQYRLRCTTTPVPAQLVHDSWLLRPQVPKQLDWFYTQQQPQSSTVADRSTLLAALAAQGLPDPLVAPDTAGGLFLHPTLIDRLDLDQPDGVHDRRHFRRTDQGWLESVLVP
jgi:pyridoxine/pyridoxamine 5'-phosphate oxidase